jgi:hypothetical protein
MSVEQGDGSKISYETYELKVKQESVFPSKEVIEFMTTASILGYHSSIGPVVIPEPTHSRFSLKNTGYDYLVIFCLERTAQSP